MNNTTTNDTKSSFLTIVGAIVAMVVGLWIASKVVGAVVAVLKFGVFVAIVAAVFWLVMKVVKRS